MNRSGYSNAPPDRGNVQGFTGHTVRKMRPTVHEVIGRRLKLHYGDIEQQPMPSRIADLLAELDAQDDEPKHRQD